jgi:glutamate/tyrosine decarboxylase-like PLP-dependent enzyme
MLAEMYSNMFNSQGFDWICNPAATELEGVVMNWLGQLLALDDSFLSDKSETKGCGSIQATASEGTLVSMIAARNKVLKKLTDIPSFNDNEEFRDTKKLVVYTSNQVIIPKI